MMMMMMMMMITIIITYIFTLLDLRHFKCTIKGQSYIYFN